MKEDKVVKAIYDTRAETPGGPAKGFWFAPIILTSGKISVMYANHRAMSYHPDVSGPILDEFVTTVEKLDPEFIVSTAEAGIFWGANVARELDLGFAYLSKSGKIAGIIPKDIGRVTGVDDLNTTYGTLIKLVDGVRAYGSQIEQCVVNIDRQEPTPQNQARFNELGVELIALRTAAQLIEYGLEHGLVEPEQEAIVRSYQQDPDACAIEIVQANPQWFAQSDRRVKAQAFYADNDRVRDAIEEVLLEQGII
jgi:orotate phosphoribosyltransferase